MSGTGSADEPEFGEEWTQRGEFEWECAECGAIVEPVVFFRDDRKRVEFTRRGDHACPALAGRIEDLRAAYLERLKAMPEATARRIRMAAHLPEKCPAGLSALEVTPGNSAALGAAWDLVYRFQRGDRSRGLYLWGQPGRGKSAITMGLAFDLVARTGTIRHPRLAEPLFSWGPRAAVQWWDTPRLFHEMGLYFRDKSREYEPTLIDRCDLLVLDDLGKEQPKDWVARTLFRIVNDRYNANRALVWTANADPEEVMAWMVVELGDEFEIPVQALFRRIAETCDVVELTGPEWRAGKAA